VRLKGAGGGATVEKRTFRIEGMSCGHCVNAVKKALSGLPGVTAEDVQIGSAKVTFDPTTASPEQIRTAIQNEGYRVSDAGRP
jgi:copper chaperone